MAATEDILRVLQDVVEGCQSSMGVWRVDELAVGSRAARTAVIAGSPCLFRQSGGPGTAGSPVSLSAETTICPPSHFYPPDPSQNKQ